MWLQHDRPYHEAINNGAREEKLSAIQQAVNYYKVARNLPKAYDEDIGCDRYGPILEIIDTVIASDFPLAQCVCICGKRVKSPTPDIQSPAAMSSVSGRNARPTAHCVGMKFCDKAY